jgi:hypothetical protein
MLQKEEAIRKHMDEFVLMKQKITTMSKKDTGSLAVRDFTDDIYNKQVSAECFVEAHHSEMFVNMLLVVQNEKVAAFRDSMITLMVRYYEGVDNADIKRIREAAKNKFNDIMNNHKKCEDAKRKYSQQLP